jgi:hypothetical protein
MKYNFIKKTVLAIVLLVIISAPFANAAQSERSPIDTTDNPMAHEMQTIVILLITLFAAATGAIVGVAMSNYYVKKRSDQEYIALILAFCTEMVSLFCRCVMYYNQSKKRVTSYSALFSFTDSTALSKFASVCQKPAVVAAIVELKSRYFQIQRHVEEASRLAVASKLASTEEDQNTFMEKAVLAQRTAVAFFISPYEAIEREMNLLVDTTLQVAPGSVANDLHDKYSKALSDKKNIDQGIPV